MPIPLPPGIRRAFRLAVRRPDQLARDVREELEHHLALSVERLVAAGHSPAAARAEALRRLGVPTAELPEPREPLRDVHRTLYDAARRREGRLRVHERGEALASDVRQAVRAAVRAAVRSAVRAPAVAALVALTFALGIGANAVMFGIVDRLVLRGPAGIADAQQVRRLYATEREPGAPERTASDVPYATYADLRAGGPAFAAVAAYTRGGSVLVGRGADAERLHRQSATWTLFPLLGVRPHLGRFFTAAEDRAPAGEPVAVLGHAAWRERFGSDPGVVGRTIHVDRAAVTVVGVAPAGFTGADFRRVDLWLPASYDFARAGVPDWETTRARRWLQVVVRLAPGVDPARADAEATAAHQRALAALPRPAAAPETRLSLRPLRLDGRGAESLESRVAYWLAAMAAVVLLVGCANVANLLLARALGRRREIAVRLAVGIGRARLVRLLLAESLVLTGAGGLVGLAVAYWGGHAARLTLLPGLAWDGAPVDGRVLGFALAATIGTGLLVGLVPALRASRPAVADALRAGGRRTGGARAPLRAALVGAQSALSVVLLAAAGLFVRSLWSARSVDLGIEPARVLSVGWSWERGLDELPAGPLRDAERARRRLLHERALGELARVPGVAAALSKPLDVVPRVPGRDSLPRLAGGGPYVTAVTGAYFATAGTTIVRGRALADADRAGSEPVAVVNRTMARTVWPGDDPLGRCIVVGADAPCARIVGVAEDVHLFGLREDPAMQLYVPYAQHAGGTAGLLVRPRGDPAAFVPELRRALRRLDPTLATVDATRLQDAVDAEVRPWRLGALVFSAFGAVAVLVGAVGLYGATAYAVAQRTHEIAVRLAHGARAADVRRLVLGSAVGAAGAGVAVGTGAALAGGRWIAPLLFETSPRDPAVFGAAAALLLAVAALAALGPARRLTRVDPAEALRAE